MKPKKPTPAAPKTRTMPRPYAISVESHLLNTNKGQEGVLIPVAVIPCRSRAHARAVAKLHGKSADQMASKMANEMTNHDAGRSWHTAYHEAFRGLRALGLAPGGARRSNL